MASPLMQQLTQRDILALAGPALADRAAREAVDLQTVERVAAFTLSLPWPKSAVSRYALAATLPQDIAGRSRKTRQALRIFEGQEWVEVGRLFVMLYSPKSLREFAIDGSNAVGLVNEFFNPTHAAAIVEAAANAEEWGMRARLLQEAAFLRGLS